MALSGPLVGCAGSQSVEGVASEADAAGRAFGQAMKTYNRKNYIEAITQFSAFRSRYPYSQHAAEATLRIGDCHYHMGKYAEAVETYRAFARFHPNNERVPYAAFMVGKSYYKQLPGDWFITPPSHEKDQTATKQAMRELDSFLARYPDAEERQEAEKMAEECREILANHEMYVAQFYMKRQQHKAAVNRLSGLASAYPNSPQAADALILAGQLLIDLEEPHRAANSLQKFLQRYPDDSRAKNVELMLKTIQEVVGQEG